MNVPEFLEQIQKRQTEHSVRCASPVIRHESFVETSNAFDFESFRETIYDVVVEKPLTVLSVSCE